MCSFARLDRMLPLLLSSADQELEAMESDPYGLQFQALLQTTSHAERLGVFKYLIDTERKRLAARATLQSMFKAD